MMNIVLTENGAVEAPGTPDYYLTDVDFIKVQTDVNFAKNLYDYFQDRVCLGRLGTTDTYVEKIFEEPIVEAENANLCFYEKVDR